MSKLKKEQQEVKQLVVRVAEGDCEAFEELVGLTRPLMVSLSKKFSDLHYRFEFDDFYAICMNALYEACMEYNPRNPSFFSYSKSFMLRQCWRELEYWNADMRNIFVQDEVSCDATMFDEDSDMEYSIQLIDEHETSEIAERGEFKSHIAEIIDTLFVADKHRVMKLYVVEDMSPKDISAKTGLHYQNTYAIIRRGMEKVTKEYKERYLPLTIS
jgi:RNA polymerase sigma factor (sigma-70 family)